MVKAELIREAHNQHEQLRSQSHNSTFLHLSMSGTVHTRVQHARKDDEQRLSAFTQAPPPAGEATHQSLPVTVKILTEGGMGLREPAPTS